MKRERGGKKLKIHLYTHTHTQREVCTKLHLFLQAQAHMLFCFTVRTHLIARVSLS